MIKIGDVLEVKIEKMANRGKGLARHNEQVIFIPYSAPGDVVSIKVQKVSKNFVEAEIVDIIQPSSMRVSAPCPHYTQCGGCHFQHISYDKQVEIKDQLVKETLQRALNTIEIKTLLQPVPSPQPWNYRNRVQVHIENENIGFNKRNTHSIIPIENCQIAEVAINESFKSVKMNPDLMKNEKIEILIDKNLKVQYRDLNSQGQPLLFSQVNRFANELLVKLVVDKVTAAKPKNKIYDLYSGDGNFLTAIAKKFPQQESIGVELNPGLAKQGREEIAQLKLNAKYVVSAVEKFLESVSIDASDVIVLDPPRTGCDAQTIMILGSNPHSNVVYVSCEPTTLARDLKLLKETTLKWGLNLKINSVQTLDMFPQTEHIETVVEFSIEKIDTHSTNH
jgi:23S rRNA (uracil1939-C5)-methyltransferase